MVRNSIDRGLGKSFFLAVFSALLLIPLVNLHFHEMSGACFAASDELFEVNEAKVKQSIEDYFSQLDIHLNDNDISRSRQAIELIEHKVDHHRKRLSREERSNYKKRVNMAESAIAGKVDSLVNMNILVLTQSGSEAAIEYRQNLAWTHGLSEQELFQVDQAILDYQPLDQRKRDIEIRQEALRKVERGHDISQVQDDEVAAVARRIKIAKEDSIRIEVARKDSIDRVEAERQRQEQLRRQAKKMALESAAKIEVLLGADKGSEAYTVFKIYRASLREHLDDEAYKRLSTRVGAANTQYREKHGDALQKSEDILELVSKNRGNLAHKEFTAHRASLQAYLGGEQYKSLSTDVAEAYSEFRKKRLKAQSVAARIRDNVADGKADRAYSSFDKHRKNLSLYLETPIFDSLNVFVERSYATMQDKTKQAQIIAKRIVGLIEERRGHAAYDLFAKNKADLEKYMDPPDYADLQASATNAKKDFTAKQTKARAFAKDLSGMVSENKIEDAYALFQSANDSLKHYLDDDAAYEKLRGGIRDAYYDMQTQRKKTAETANDIRDLIQNRRGAEALAVFQKSRSHLKEYLEAQEYSSLSSSTADANKSFINNQAIAEKNASEIRSYLAKERADKADSLFQAKRASLKHYMKRSDSYEKLKTDVAEAYAKLRENQRAAAQTVRKVNWLVAKNQGAQAYTVFVDNKSHLKKYLPHKDYSALSTAVVKANKHYKENTVKAHSNHSAVANLLTAKKPGQAYTTFQQHEENLKFYLADSTYKALKSSVDEAYGKLQGKQKEALGHARTINSFIRRSEGNRAYAEFNKRKSVLEKYLPADEYSDLQQAVYKANKEHRANVKKSVFVAASIRALLAKKNVDAAYAAFDANRVFLRQYMTAKTYKTLETEVLRPYEALKRRRKDARGVVFRINWMLRWGRVPDAHEEFLDKRNSLKQYLSAEEYTKTLERVTEDYRKHMAARASAEKTARGIRSHLSQNRVAKAHEVFSQNRGDLKKFLPQKEYNGLQAEVRDTYSEMVERRREVDAFVRKLYTLVRRDQVWEAYKTFRKNRTELRKNLDEAEYDKLEKTVVGTYKEMRAKGKKK